MRRSATRPFSKPCAASGTTCRRSATTSAWSRKRCAACAWWRCRVLAHPVPACATPSGGGDARSAPARRRSICTARMTLELLAHRHPPEALHDPLEHDFIRPRPRSTGSRTRCRAGPIRSSSTTRTPTFTWTCRNASTATAACASATKSRASSSGRPGTAATTPNPPAPARPCWTSPCVSCGAASTPAPRAPWKTSPSSTRHPDRLDENHLLLLRHRLRINVGTARRPHHHDPPGPRSPCEQGPPLRQGPLRL